MSSARALSAAALAAALVAAPARAEPPGPVTDREFLEPLINDLRRDVEAANKARDDQVDLIERAATAALEEHKVADRETAAAIRAIDSRVSLIDGVNATVAALSQRVDRLAISATELQAASQTATASAAATGVPLEEHAKAITLRADAMQAIIDRNSERLTKLETGGSVTAQEATAAAGALAARVTAIESAANGANWVYQAMLAIGAFVAGVMGTWAMVRSARHESEATVARRSRSRA